MWRTSGQQTLTASPDLRGHEVPLASSSLEILRHCGRLLTYYLSDVWVPGSYTSVRNTNLAHAVCKDGVK